LGTVLSVLSRVRANIQAVHVTDPFWSTLSIELVMDRGVYNAMSHYAPFSDNYFLHCITASGEPKSKSDSGFHTGVSQNSLVTGVRHAVTEFLFSPTWRAPDRLVISYSNNTRTVIWGSAIGTRDRVTIPYPRTCRFVLQCSGEKRPASAPGSIYKVKPAKMQFSATVVMAHLTGRACPRREPHTKRKPCTCRQP
jgi:hypothetical protein